MSFGRSASEYNIGVLELIGKSQTIDISRIFIEMNIYESLLENSMTFDISLLDTFNLFKNIPIVGGETQIHVIVNSPLIDGLSSSVDDIDMIFTIYTVSNRHNYKDRTQMYVLHGITPEKFTDVETKINRSYVNVKDRAPDKIVIDIFNTYIDTTTDLETETCSNSVNVIFPSHWSPFHGINWLTKCSQSSLEHNGTGFLFYENVRGYHFKSIESLSTEDTTHLLIYESINIDADILPHEGNIVNYKFDSMFNSLNNITRGMMHSKLISHDLTLKTITNISDTYIESFDSTTSHVDTNPMFNKIFDSVNSEPHKLFVNCASSKVYDVATAPSKKNTLEITLPRNRRLQESNNVKLQLIISGNSTIAVGDTVKFNLPNNESENIQTNSIDTVLSGKFLVLNVRHKIDTTSYATILTIIKDSFSDGWENTDGVVDANTNTAKRGFF